MAINATNTAITLDASAVGCVQSFSIPGANFTEYNATCLDDTYEVWIKGVLELATELTFVVILDTLADAVTKASTGAWVVTISKQVSGSTIQRSYSFTGYVRDVGSMDGDASGTEALTQEFTVRLTSVVTSVVES